MPWSALWTPGFVELQHLWDSGQKWELSEYHNSANAHFDAEVQEDHSGPSVAQVGAQEDSAWQVDDPHLESRRTQDTVEMKKFSGAHQDLS